MAIIGNRVTQEGDILYIETEIPAIGLLALTGFLESTTGETSETYYDKQFKYSLDGGVSFSNWIPLSLQNIQAVQVQPSDIVFFQYRYKRIGQTAEDLTFSFNEIDATYDPASLVCGYYFNNSIFKKYLECNSVEVLGWYVNVTEKLYKTTNIAKYVGRLNENGSSEDFLIFWRWVSKFFAYYVIYARQFGRFYENEDLLREFLIQRNIAVSSENSLIEMLKLTQEFNHQLFLRGTTHIYKDKTTPDRDWEEVSEIDGEMLRLIDYRDQDEFIYINHQPSLIGWKLDKASPQYRGLAFEINADKIYEPNGPTDILRWPSNGSVSSGQITLDAGESISAAQGDKFIKVNKELDYILTLSIKGTGTVSIGVDGFNEDDTAISLKSVKNNANTNISITAFSPIRADKFYTIRVGIFNKNKLTGIGDKTNLGIGNNLKLMDNIVKIIPNISVTTGSFIVKDISFKPLLTSYSRGFVQVKNLASAFLINSSDKSLNQLQSWINKYLIPYSSIVKLNQIGTYQYTSTPESPFSPPAIQLAWGPQSTTCSYEVVEGELVGLLNVNTLYQYEVLTGQITGLVKENTIEDPDYIAPQVSAQCPVYYNLEVSQSFTRNNCNLGETGQTVTYTIPAGQYAGETQIEANNLAQNDLSDNGQAYANANGSCSILVGNEIQQQDFTKNNCQEGFHGSIETYIVEPDTYFANTISEANELAQNDISDNGQAYANAQGECILSDSNPFAFLTIFNVPINSIVYSSTITVDGPYPTYRANANTAGLEFEINGSGIWVTEGIVFLGSSIRLRQTTSGSYSDVQNNQFNLGNTSAIWNIFSEEDPLSGGGSNCTEYFNNNGVAIEDVNYIECGSNAQINGATIESNQSFCAVDGTISGSGAGSLITLGPCQI